MEARGDTGAKVTLKNLSVYQLQACLRPLLAKNACSFDSPKFNLGNWALFSQLSNWSLAPILIAN